MKNKIAKITVLFTLLYHTLALSLGTGIFAVIPPVSSSDNRPMLWINMESDNNNIHLFYFRGRHYDFISIIENKDTSRVLMGMNTAGFALVYTTAFDQTGDSLADNSQFTKSALGLCGKVDDLKELLQKNHPNANFGCFDVYGNCAVFESGLDQIKEYNVTDSTDAADGFLVRSNFSFSGKKDVPGTSWRYHRACELLSSAVETHNLDYKYLIQHVARDLKNADMDPYPLPYKQQFRNAPEGFIKTNDSINQSRTVVSAVFMGASKQNNAEPASLWIIPGEPVCGVAVPLWPQCSNIPKELTGNSISNMNKVITEIHNRIYYKKKWPTYLDSKLYAQGKNSVLSKILKTENEIFADTEKFKKNFQTKIIQFKDIEKFQKKMIYKAIKILRK